MSTSISITITTDDLELIENILKLLDKPEPEQASSLGFDLTPSTGENSAGF